MKEIQKQIMALGEVDKFGTRKEIQHLPSILDKSESILGLTSGLLDGNTWLIVCTEHRVIFLDKGMLFGLKHRETPLEKINSVEYRIGLLMGSITIWDGAAKITIANIEKRFVIPFVKSVEKARKKLRSNMLVSQTNKSGEVVSQLERLALLRDTGILTDAEFMEQKKKILEMGR